MTPQNSAPGVTILNDATGVMALTANLTSDKTNRDGVEDTTFEAKAKDRLFEDRPSRGQGQKDSRARPNTKNTIFLNYGRQIFNYF